MTALVVLPALFPMGTGLLCILLPRFARVRQAAAFVGATGMLVSGAALLAAVRRSGIVAVQSGGWAAPFGISLVADLTSTLFVTVAALVGWTTVLFSLRGIPRRHQAGAYYPLVMLLLAAVSGAFLTGDLFNLFVWFEVIFITSFALAVLRNNRATLEGATKYLTLTLIGSALLLSGVGMVYGLAGTLNMAELSRALRSTPPGPTTAVALLLFIAFALKAAAFPLFSWLPASYHVVPTAISSLFSALLTKVGVYALLRAFTLLFVQDAGFFRVLLLVTGVLTMVTGVLGAVAQFDLRRLLSFHIISQIGYLIVGIGLQQSPAVAATLVFFVHVIFAKSALFLVAGIAGNVSGTFDLKKMGGLYRRAPGLSVVFLLPALSLAGIPPLSGFVAKFSLVRAALLQESWWIAAAALVVGLLTLFSMIKIWREAFWKDAPEGDPAHRDRKPHLSMMVGCTVLAAQSLLWGLMGQPLLEISSAAAEQMLDPGKYIQAVLREK